MFERYRHICPKSFSGLCWCCSAICCTNLNIILSFTNFKRFIYRTFLLSLLKVSINIQILQTDNYIYVINIFKICQCLYCLNYLKCNSNFVASAKDLNVKEKQTNPYNTSIDLRSDNITSHCQPNKLSRKSMKRENIQGKRIHIGCSILFL